MSRLVAVTGACGALGSAVASQLVERGYEIAVIDLADCGEAQRGIVAVVGVDLAEPIEVKRAFDRVRREAGSLRGLVNIAGGFAWETTSEGSIDTWDRMYRLNVRTTVNSCNAALPLMAPGSSIVNVGALGALRGGIGTAAYAASKSGVARLTESLAAELKDRRIRVNAVLPSIIDTPANRSQMPDADFRTWVTTDQVAEVIAFLLSSNASGVSGGLVPVAGGAHMA